MGSKLDFLKQAGFDVDAGLGYLGTEDMYLDILKEFQNGFIEQMTNIKTTFEKQDFPNYVILVHALKSNCRTLGITNLFEIAYNHEMKGKENDIDYINKNIAELFNTANEIYLFIDRYLKSLGE